MSDYNCAHCGQRSGMYGHNHKPWPGGPPICENSDRNWYRSEGRQTFSAEADTPGAFEMGFCCPVGHVCSERNR